MSPWALLLMVELAMSEATRMAGPHDAASDSLALLPDSVCVTDDVPLELLEELDLLLDLELLEFVDVFGDADLAVLAPELAEDDSATSRQE